jgi:catechol 2,3-dioxygenase-like lactoylglutathione lyase family enzyme
MPQAPKREDPKREDPKREDPKREDAVKPSHLGLCVADLERSLRFYCDGLGFVEAEVYNLDEQMLDGLDRALEVERPVKLRSQMITNGDLKIELLHYTTPVPTGSPSTSRGQIGFTHLSFFVADVDQVAAKLATLGGTILDDTRRQLGYEVVFVADPDGARVELMARPHS